MAKFDLTRPYRTRDGREAQAILAPDGRLYGWMRHDDGGVCQGGWSVEGEYTPSKKGPADLVNIPEKRTVKAWINCYESAVSWQVLYVRRSDADACASPECIACIEREITFEVGEGLEEK